ncbi:restriction endonuclease [Shewanella sp. 10N.286.51.B7]|uniref:McrB family protein n=1 Tax=Shewanella sp. 10N.286.51.B7 TaxID=1880836 RepID=UPI000C84BC39|nr:restriction endonuclease [Shewanella sp. 10N.286.51.B7]PMG79019.1 restriction endonuclease [Shewanella sp. 10N.286.51.B7]
MELIDLKSKFNEIESNVNKVEFRDVRLAEKFKVEYEKYISGNAANGYSEVEWADFSTRIITTTGKSIFLTNYWFFIASELAGYLKGLNEHKHIFKQIFEGENLQEIAVSLRKGLNDVQSELIQKFFTSNGHSLQECEFFKTFVSDYSSWGGGKTIDRNDYYVSPLLQAGKLLAETQSAVAEIAKQFAEESALRESFLPVFEPLSSKLDVKKSSPLLSEHSRGKFVYLLIEFLITKTRQEPLFKYLIEKEISLGNYNLEYKGYRLTTIFKVSNVLLSEEQLSSGEKNRFFEKPFILDSKMYYLSNQWTDGTSSRLDIQSLIPIFNSLYVNYEILVEDGIYILKESNNLVLQQVTKPFLLLAGISGTGKTRFVREQAKKTGSLSETYCLTSVRPDWHEPSDLLGYVSRLGGKPQYVATDVLRFIVRAWREIIEKIERDSNGVAIDWRGHELAKIRPFWLCLDEMNLAPVEQYFADYLSVLETRCWNAPDKLKKSGLSYVYECDPLIKGEVFSSLDADVFGKTSDSEKPSSLLAKDLGFDLKNDTDKDIWDYFLAHGISIPFNLIVTGTVNMDETTHGFSRKVIDRALTFDFGEFFPNNIDEFFEAKFEPKKLSYPTCSQAKFEQFSSVAADPKAQKTTAFFKAMNAVLQGTPFELAFRAFNELCLSVISFAPENDEQLAAVFDDFLMCKVLPRIEGDEDKLQTLKGEALLQSFKDVIAKELNHIWDGERVDLLRENKGSGEKVIKVQCRSKIKLESMQTQLNSGFTSFWP